MLAQTIAMALRGVVFEPKFIEQAEQLIAMRLSDGKVNALKVRPMPALDQRSEDGAPNARIPPARVNPQSREFEPAVALWRFDSEPDHCTVALCEGTAGGALNNLA